MKHHEIDIKISQPSYLSLRLAEGLIAENTVANVKIIERWLELNQIKRKNVQGLTPATGMGQPVTNAKVTVQNLPLPKSIKEEGELLYRQYFMFNGMSSELRDHLKQTLNWTDKQVTTHMRYMTKQWRHRRDEYKRSLGFPIKKRHYRPGTLALWEFRKYQKSNRFAY